MGSTPVSFTDCRRSGLAAGRGTRGVAPSQLRLMHLFNPRTGETFSGHGAEALSVIPISLIQVSPQIEKKVPWQGRPDRD